MANESVALARQSSRDARRTYKRLESEYLQLAGEFESVRRTSLADFDDDEPEQEAHEKSELGRISEEEARGSWADDDTADEASQVVYLPLQRATTRRDVTLRQMGDRVHEVGMRLEAAEKMVLEERAGCCAGGCARAHMMVRECGAALSASRPGLVRWLFTMPMGVLSSVIFYADVVADSQVAYTLWVSNNPIWALESCAFLVSQYLMCYAIVLLYLCRTERASRGHGCTTRIAVFALLGMPLAPLLLDIVMFLEPLTLLPTLRHCLPSAAAEEMISLLPRYRKARTIIEVLLEGIPQSVLELYIFLRLNFFSGQGFCLEVDHQHAFYDIDLEVLKRSFFLTALGIAKLAFDYFWSKQEYELDACTYLSTSLSLRPETELKEASPQPARSAVPRLHVGPQQPQPDGGAPAQASWRYTLLGVLGLGAGSMV